MQTYVTDLIRRDAAVVTQHVMQHGAHYYVCGDVTMAQDVGETLERVISQHGGMDDSEAAEYVLQMKVSAELEQYNLIPDVAIADFVMVVVSCLDLVFTCYVKYL